MDCEIRLGCGPPRQRFTRNNTSTTAIVNSEIAITNMAVSSPVVTATKAGLAGAAALGAAVRAAVVGFVKTAVDGDGAGIAATAGFEATGGVEVAIGVVEAGDGVGCGSGAAAFVCVVT